MTAIIRADDERFVSLRNILAKNMKSLAQALPQGMGGDQNLRRFAQVCVNAIHQNPGLLNCTPESFFHSVRQSASLGLEPNGALGLAYLIPYGRECQFQIGYKGLCELARRSGNVKSIYAYAVYPGDEFRYSLGLHRDLQHTPAGMADRDAMGALHVMSDGEVDIDKPIYAYGVVILKDGDAEFEVINQRYIEKIKKASKSSNNPSSPWNVWPDAMWRKTAIKQVLKYVALSPDDALAKVLESDAGFDIGATIAAAEEKRADKEAVQTVAAEVVSSTPTVEVAEADLPPTVGGSALVSDFVAATEGLDAADPEQQKRTRRRA